MLASHRYQLDEPARWPHCLGDVARVLSGRQLPGKLGRRSARDDVVDVERLAGRRPDVGNGEEPRGRPRTSHRHVEDEVSKAQIRKEAPAPGEALEMIDAVV